MNLLSGQPGTAIKVGVIRRGKATPEEVDLVREKLATPKIIAQKVDADILVLRIPSLDAGRADEIRNRLLDAEKQGIRKVILDVRECGRGQVSEAISTARLFVPSGMLTTLRGQTVSALILTVANYYNPGGKSIMEEGVVPTEVVHAVPEDDSDSTDEDAAPAPETQKEPGLGPRPLSPEDPIFHRALDLLKAPVKKAA
jgi:C-terminal processing protease CtpA/Prc